jgi:putative transposase
VLLRLAYLTVTNAFAVLRLLPVGDRDKDVVATRKSHVVSELVEEVRRMSKT